MLWGLVWPLEAVTLLCGLLHGTTAEQPRLTGQRAPSSWGGAASSTLRPSDQPYLLISHPLPLLFPHDAQSQFLSLL